MTILIPNFALFKAVGVAVEGVNTLAAFVDVGFTKPNIR